MSKKNLKTKPHMPKKKDETFISSSLLINFSIFLLTAIGTYFIVTSNVDSRLDKAIDAKADKYKEKIENLIEEGETKINETIKKAKDSRRLVALISDFGVGSYYMHMLKGKIIQSYTHTSIIDITHDITTFDEIEGAWILHNASYNFPDETIFWGMINPGAELSKNSIFIITKEPRQYFIGASRNLFENVISNQGLEAAFVPTFRKEDDKFGTTTFTDLISVLLNGGSIKELESAGLLGENITKKYIDDTGTPKTTLITTTPNVLSENSVSGYVCTIDRWGNLLTNIKNDKSFFQKDTKYSVEINSKTITGFIYGDSYLEGKDKPGVIIEQDNWMQIAIHEKSVNEKYFQLEKAGASITIRKE